MRRQVGTTFQEGPKPASTVRNAMFRRRKRITPFTRACVKGVMRFLDRKDDAEYVAALLRHGARVDDRRETVQMTDGGRAIALHYAAKAGFVKTIELLLDHGADP